MRSFYIYLKIYATVKVKSCFVVSFILNHRVREESSVAGSVRSLACVLGKSNQTWRLYSDHLMLSHVNRGSVITEQEKIILEKRSPIKHGPFLMKIYFNLVLVWCHTAWVSMVILRLTPDWPVSMNVILELAGFSLLHNTRSSFAVQAK